MRTRRQTRYHIHMSHPAMVPVAGEPRSRVALFGFPVGHSVSPALHHAAAQHLGITLRYEAVLTRAEELATAVERLRAPVWLGANVTVPHKQAASMLVDTLAATAAAIGAVNTIYKQDGLLVGDNTDVGAVERVLTDRLQLDPAQECILLLGAGGAARGCLAALAHLEVQRIRIWNRTMPSALAMLEHLRGQGLWRDQQVDVAVVGDPREALGQATLLINATSAGLDGQGAPIDPALLPPLRVFDLVYGVDGTPLVRAARERGLVALDGLWMLVYQAAAAFALWTGLRPPEALMYSAALAQLEARRIAQAPDPHRQALGAP